MSSSRNSRDTVSCLVAILAGGLFVAICVVLAITLSLSGMVALGTGVIANADATETAAAETGTAAAALPFVDVPTLTRASTVLPDAPTASSTPIPSNILGDLPPPSATAIASATSASLGLPVPPEIEQGLPPPAAYQLLGQLETVDLPPRDYHAVASRLLSRDPGPRTLNRAGYQIGDQQSFITDQGRATAVLMAVTQHAYFWVDTEASVSEAAVLAAAERFEIELYPRVIALLGTPWQPGVDNDPRFSILHLASFADNHLGFFDQADEYPQTVAPASNEQEIFYLNLEQLSVGEPLYFGTLVHELEHLIQWYVDGNEPIWMDEGLAQLTEIYLGFDTVATIDYLLAPETQLNSWSYDDEDARFAHYAAGYLFATYLWEQLGDRAIQELSRHPGNGLQAVAAVLRGYRPGSDLADFFGDWAIANWLDNPAIDDRYGYRAITLEQPDVWDTAQTLPYSDLHSLNQFGVHYIDLDFSGPAELSFAGDTTTDLLPAAPRSGEKMWLAVGADNVDARLTATVDLTGLSQATLNFWAWYDLEEGIDMVYVTVSTDGGATWQILLPEHRGAGEFGPGFTGRSRDEPDAVAGWVQESLSLSQVAGQPVLVRFNLLTDYGYPSVGFAIDDIAIPELNYYSDAEAGADGWEAIGFIQGGHRLPQAWRVQLIDRATGRVAVLPLDATNQGQWGLNLGQAGGVLVIAPVTPFVREPANYWLQLTSP